MALPKSTTEIIRFMIDQNIGLPAAAALGRRGVKVACLARLQVVEVDPDDIDPDDIDPDEDEEADEDEPIEELRWTWFPGADNPPSVVTNEQDVLIAYHAAVEAGSPPEFAAFDRGGGKPAAKGGVKVESDKGTAPATAVVGDQDGAAEERARILAGLPEDLIDPCDAVLRGGRAIRLATLAALAGNEAWKNADTDLRLDVKARLESYVHAQLFERFLGRYDKRSEDWVDPLRVQADEDDEEVVLGEVDADEAVDAVLDGLAWKNTLSIFGSRAKTGKTTVIVDRLAAAFEAGRIPKLALVFSEMSSARMRRFCNLRRFRPEWLARVRVSKIKNVQKCVKRIKALDPDFVLVDSLTPLVVASGGRPGSLWDPIVSRSVLQPLADTGACVLTTHHTRKEDGALRDSGDIEAGVDMIITTVLDDPKSDRPKIVGLRYNGRFDHADEDLEFIQAEARYQKRGPSENTPGTLDPFQIQDPLAPVVAFAQGWLMQNPDGGKKAYRDAARGAGHRLGQARLDAALDRARNQNPLPPGTAGTPPLNAPCPAVPSSAARSGHGAGHGAGHAVPEVPGPIVGTVPGTVPGARLPGTDQTTSDAPAFDPGGAFTATPAEETPNMPRDILTANPADLTDAEHAELVSAWDAALTKAQQGGAKWAPVNPAAILATNKHADRPDLRRALTRSTVRLTAHSSAFIEIPEPAGGWPLES